MESMDIGLEGLLQIIGELEVNKRVLTDAVEKRDTEIEKREAKIIDLEQQIVAFKNLGSKPTPIIVGDAGGLRAQDAEDNVQTSQD